MRRQLKVSGLIVLLVVVTFITFFQISNLKQSSSQIKNPEVTNNVDFFDENSFYEGLVYAQQNKKVFDTKIAGGIVPHHLYPSYIISDFFNALSEQKPKTVIIIGPNHYEAGSKKIITSLKSWKTPLGIVEADQASINRLIVNGLMEISDEVMVNEHSIAGLLPFLEHYIPDAMVVPILVNGFLTNEETIVLSESIENVMDGDSVLIASVDFSHNLVSMEAEKRDIVTMGLMMQHEYSQLLELGSEYLDSPASIVVLLRTMRGMDKNGMKILQHTNSGMMQRNDSIETTSYYSVVYY